MLNVPSFFRFRGSLPPEFRSGTRDFSYPADHTHFIPGGYFTGHSCLNGALDSRGGESKSDDDTVSRWMRFWMEVWVCPFLPFTVYPRVNRGELSHTSIPLIHPNEREEPAASYR